VNLATHKSAEKRARQSTKKRARNRMTKSSVATAERKLRQALTDGNFSLASDQLKLFTSRIAKAARKGVLHLKAASRKISRLSSQVAALTKRA
jgi:small subunit ribosomal protein S20